MDWLARGFISASFPAQLSANGQAYTITAFEPKDAPALLDALERIRASPGDIYLFWRERRLVVGADGEEVEIVAREFAGEFTDLSAQEWLGTVKYWRMLYDDVDAFGAQVQGRIGRIQALATEQLRRTSIKATSRSEESAVGILYFQQIEFLRKLITACEGDDDSPATTEVGN